tara:strand:+ start:210 stop:524 length:315 start_codon:yes stop_codon:yes gene_type:complete
MICKKKIFIFFICGFLGACASPTAVLGPAYTFSSTGNALQAGFSYGSGELITQQTGKTPFENIKEMSVKNENNIKKKTLESEDFFQLINARVKKTNSVLKSSNQ